MKNNSESTVARFPEARVLRHGVVVKHLSLVCGSMLFLHWGAVTAQEAAATTAATNAPSSGATALRPAGATEVNLVMGAQHEMTFPAGIERIAMGDDTVANVNIKRIGKGSGARILVTPLKPGGTTFMVWSRGEAQARSYWLNVQQRVQLRTNKAGSLVEQQFASELAAAQAGDKVKTVDLSSVQLKSNVVQVDVKVVEFNKTLLKKAGVNIFSTSPNSHGFSFGVFGKSAYGGGGSNTAAEVATPLSAAFNLVMQFDKAAIGVNLGMLEANGLARVMASPTLVALSGQSANFLSGGEVPVPVPAGQGLVAIQYKPYGIGLTVAPTVLSNDRIVLKVAPEASELDYINTVPLQGVSVPAITTRRADTTVELGDGESFIIGGLVSRTTTSTTDKVPLLGDIPVLGVLFKRQEFSQKESELAIIVTPRLVKPLARDVDLEPLLPGRAEQRNPMVWGPWLAGGLSRGIAPGFSR